MTFRLIKTKTPIKHHHVDHRDQLDVRFILFGSFQLRMTLPPKSEAANIGGFVYLLLRLCDLIFTVWIFARILSMTGAERGDITH